MRPEEGKGAHQQPDHQLGRHPDLRIAAKVVAVPMRLEAGIARRRNSQIRLAAVALPASLHAIVRMDLGHRVLDLQYFVAAMAVIICGPDSGDVIRPRAVRRRRREVATEQFVGHR